MPERLECEILQKARYINTLTFTLYLGAFSVGRLCIKFSHTAKFGFYFTAAFDPTPTFACAYIMTIRFLFFCALITSDLIQPFCTW